MDRISTIAERLKEYRNLKSMTLSDLGKITDIPPQTLNRYELEQRIPKIDVAIEIAEKLHVNPLWLQGYDVDMDSHPEDYLSLEISSISNLVPLPKTKRVPLLGTIACGEPILAEENLDGYVEMAEEVTADFALRCRGDSMVNARILDGDLVFVRQQPDVENGEIAAVLIGDEATLKRVYKYPQQVVLQPENPKYPPLVYAGEQLQELRILGKAVAFLSRVK